MGLQGMINDLVRQSDFPIGKQLNGELEGIAQENPTAIARIISAAENFPEVAKDTLQEIHQKIKPLKPCIGYNRYGRRGEILFSGWIGARFLIDFLKDHRDCFGGSF